MVLDLWKDPAVEKIMRPVAVAVTATWERLQQMHDRELDGQLRIPEELIKTSDEFETQVSDLRGILYIAANGVLLEPECPKEICELMIHGVQLAKLAAELKDDFDNLSKALRAEPSKGENPEVYRLEFKTLIALLSFRLAMQASGVPIALKEFTFGASSTD
jgi:hypothetical protein